MGDPRACPTSEAPNAKSIISRSIACEGHEGMSRPCGTDPSMWLRGSGRPDQMPLRLTVQSTVIALCCPPIHAMCHPSIHALGRPPIYTLYHPPIHQT